METTVYLGMLELLSHLDDFLKQHTQKLANLGSSSYKLCTCRQQSVKSLCTSWEYVFWMRSFLASNVPSRPTIELRVFQCQSRGVWTKLMKHATPVERFVTLMPNQGHTAEKLATRGIDIKHCRGES